MIKTSVRTAAATALLGMAALSLSTTANAGDGKAVGAGLLGFGVGAIVGSANRTTRGLCSTTGSAASTGLLRSRRVWTASMVASVVSILPL